jgi:anti-sigma-K factor RskA
MTLHEQAAAFVLDALDDEEEQRFEQHLPLCPDCEDELEPFRLAAAALAFAGELPPPRPELRRRVLATDAVVLQFRRRWTAPIVSAAVLAACAALVVGLGDRTRSIGGFHAVQGQASGLSLLRADSGEAIVFIRRLPPAQPGKVYELWVVRHGHPAPAGFLHGRSARLTRLVPRGAAVAVTLEPVGGSRRPTGPLLLRTETA